MAGKGRREAGEDERISEMEASEWYCYCDCTDDMDEDGIGQLNPTKHIFAITIHLCKSITMTKLQVLITKTFRSVPFLGCK